MILLGWMERLGRPLRWPSRALLLVAALLAVGALRLPLWTMAFQSNQYPDPLRMAIYPDHLEGQRTAERDDLREINALNHYIGMRPLSEHDFAEFVWIPLALIGLAAVALRTAAIGTLRDAVDVSVLGAIFGLYSAWQFYRRLWDYGHNLADDAPITVEGFTPPIFGRERVANFWVESYPAAGSYLVGAALALIVAALAVGLWRARRHESPSVSVRLGAA